MQLLTGYGYGASITVYCFFSNKNGKIHQCLVIEGYSNQKKENLKLNPLRANHTKWSNTLKHAQIADELFECVWPFCGVGV